MKKLNLVRSIIKFCIVTAVLTLVNPGNSAGQNFAIRNYSTELGLPHNNVRFITGDSTGFLWIATWDGLSRYDGHEFKNYFHNSSDSTSIPFFSITKLYVDRHNNLWVLTDWRQLVRYNRSKDNFITIKSIAGIPIKNIITFSPAEDGNIWIINPGEIIYWDEKNKESRVYSMKDEKGEPFILPSWEGSFIKMNDEEYWLIGSGAFRLKKGADNSLIITGRFPVRQPSPKQRIDFDFNIEFEPVIGKSGAIWILSNTGLFRFNKDAGEFSEFTGELPDKEFSGKRFFTWGTFNDGIYIYDSEKNSTRHIPFSYSKMPISICIANESLLWFSNTTTSGVSLGINKLVFTPDYFNNYLVSDKDSAAPAVYSLAMDDKGGILVGMRGYDHIQVSETDGDVTKIAKLSPELFKTAGHARSMIIDSTRKGIWIGYFTNLLQFYDQKTGLITNHFPVAAGFRAMTLTKDGKLFIGNHNLVQYDPETRSTEILWDTINPNGIFKMYLDDNGILWGGMSGRFLLRYNTLTGIARKIPLTTDNCNIEDIIPGDNGDLWLALLGEGVCQYNPSNGTFRYYTTATGLSNNTTYNLLRDRAGNIWVSTNYGISVIQPSTGKIRSFGLNDGLKISEFNSGAKFKSRDGEFIFGGMGGYARFYPDSVTGFISKVKRQGIILTSLRVSSRYKYLEEDLNTADTIILNAGENNFRINFSSSDFISSDKTIFRYRLDGIDNEWIETNAYDRNINYSNLRPRWYQLEIEATDGAGNWSASKRLVIRVKPVFYQTWAFIILTPLLIVCIIVFSIITYIRQIRQKEQQIQNELKLQSLRGQMNPHFIFNSLNSINYFISNNDKVSANRYISDFSRLIRSILSNLGNNYVPFEIELTSIEDYLKIEHLRFGDKFNYEIIADEELRSLKTEISPGLIQPLIENAIWHGVRPLENREGFIRVVFKSLTDSKMTCIVEDDGLGCRESLNRQNDISNHRSRGLQIVNERLQVMSKIRNEIYKIDITDLHNDRIETGTRVIVEIPINIAKQ